eukprot:Nk52_evm16s2578 gene=Nk52_evmTU16s2578
MDAPDIKEEQQENPASSSGVEVDVVGEAEEEKEERVASEEEQQDREQREEEESPKEEEVNEKQSPDPDVVNVEIAKEKEEVTPDNEDLDNEGAGAVEEQGAEDNVERLDTEELLGNDETPQFVDTSTPVNELEDSNAVNTDNKQEEDEEEIIPVEEIPSGSGSIAQEDEDDAKNEENELQPSSPPPEPSKTPIEHLSGDLYSALASETELGNTGNDTKEEAKEESASEGENQKGDNEEPIQNGDPVQEREGGNNGVDEDIKASEEEKNTKEADSNGGTEEEKEEKEEEEDEEKNEEKNEENEDADEDKEIGGERAEGKDNLDNQEESNQDATKDMEDEYAEKNQIDIKVDEAGSEVEHGDINGNLDEEMEVTAVSREEWDAGPLGDDEFPQGDALSSSTPPPGKSNRDSEVEEEEMGSSHSSDVPIAEAVMDSYEDSLINADGEGMLRDRDDDVGESMLKLLEEDAKERAATIIQRNVRFHITRRRRYRMTQENRQSNNEIKNDPNVEKAMMGVTKKQKKSKKKKPELPSSVLNIAREVMHTMSLISEVCPGALNRNQQELVENGQCTFMSEQRRSTPQSHSQGNSSKYYISRTGMQGMYQQNVPDPQGQSKGAIYVSPLDSYDFTDELQPKYVDAMRELHENQVKYLSEQRQYPHPAADYQPEPKPVRLRGRSPGKIPALNSPALKPIIKRVKGPQSYLGIHVERANIPMEQIDLARLLLARPPSYQEVKQWRYVEKKPWLEKKKAVTGNHPQSVHVHLNSAMMSEYLENCEPQYEVGYDADGNLSIVDDGGKSVRSFDQRSMRSQALPMSAQVNEVYSQGSGRNSNPFESSASQVRIPMKFESSSNQPSQMNQYIEVDEEINGFIVQIGQEAKGQKSSLNRYQPLEGIKGTPAAPAIRSHNSQFSYKDDGGVQYYSQEQQQPSHKLLAPSAAPPPQEMLQPVQRMPQQTHYSPNTKLDNIPDARSILEQRYHLNQPPAINPNKEGVRYASVAALQKYVKVHPSKTERKSDTSTPLQNRTVGMSSHLSLSHQATQKTHLRVKKSSVLPKKPKMCVTGALKGKTDRRGSAWH